LSQMTVRTCRLLIPFLCIGFLASCRRSADQKPLDTPTSGDIRIGIDASFTPVFESEVYTFESLYPSAKVNPVYGEESRIMQMLMNDSIRLAVVPRELLQTEKEHFEKKLKIFPRVTAIAYDAIALIVNKKNPDTLIAYDQLHGIFNNKIDNWNQINPKHKNEKLRIVFDNKNSSSARYIKEQFSKNNAFPGFCFALKNNKEVIEFVENNTDALGIIGINWISDGDDPASLGFLSKIKVMAVQPADTMIGAGEYYPPYQAYIAQKTYPLVRKIYVISREARTGLGTGFSSFVAGDKGQRIILKSGLVPATMPVRIIGLDRP